MEATTEEELDPPAELGRAERSYLLKSALREVLNEYDFGDESKRKELVKQAISEWLDAKVLVFGRWSLAGPGCSAPRSRASPTWRS
jgi:hypothetical protein